MNRPIFVRTIARWLSHCLPAMALAVTLAASYHTPRRPPPDTDVVESSTDLEVHITVNWNS
jgi:hypothetical protein